MSFEIGIIVDSLKLPLKEGMYAVNGDMNPDNIDKKARKQLLKYIQSFDLKVSALCGDMGGGFMDETTNKEKILLSKKIIDLALDLQCNVVTTHIGVIPADTDSNTYRLMQNVCNQLGKYAEQSNASFAIETGPEPSHVLKDWILQI